MMIRATMNDAAAAIVDILEQFRDATQEVVQQAIQETAKEAAKEVQSNAKAKFNGTAYAAGWTYKKKSGRTLKNGSMGYTVYNRTQYRLSHLLENGHRKVLWGKRTGGRVAGRAHIEPAEKHAESMLMEKIRRGIKNET